MKPKVARPLPEVFDHPLRWFVASYTRPGKSYLVQLDSFGFNGECQCEDFEIRFAPLLLRGITPEEAIAGGLVELRNEARPRDALRCRHIVDAAMEHSETIARAYVQTEAAR
jgi:hypothetical protein